MGGLGPSDPAMDCLFWTLDREAQLGQGDRLAFLRARPHPELSRFSGRLVCEQTWKPDVNALERLGWSVVSDPLPLEPVFDRVFIRPNRQREQLLSDFARGVSLLRPGGQLAVTLPNALGPGRYAKELQRLLGEISQRSKYHCRTFWGTRPGELDEALLRAWLEGGSKQAILQGRYLSRPGVFSWDRIDPGSALLARTLPKNLRGKLADLGAGWGFLSHFLLENHPAIRSLDLFEADREALQLAMENLAKLPAPAREKASPHWHDVARGLPASAHYDAIVMNPPFHQGHQQDISLGQAFIRAAAESLRGGGQLWLVANRHLPYEVPMREILPSMRLVHEENGFKVLAAVKGIRTPR